MPARTSERRAAARPRLGHDDKPFTEPELRALVGHLSRKAALEMRRGVRRGPRRRDLLLVELAALTGLRASELAELEARDVILARRKSYLRVRGGKARVRQAVDTVPIPWSLVPELERWLLDQAGTAPVFTASTSSRKLTRWEVWRIIKRAVRACGLRDVLTAHSLRHYYISRIARESRSSLVVASLARLRSPRLVETYYHSALEDRAAVVQDLRVPGRRTSRARA